jgi:hypothetical protein
VVVSPGYRLHPEFGLLCPSPGVRRTAKVALGFLAFLAIAGALAVKLAHDLDTDGALTIAHDGAARTNAESVQAVGHATAAMIAESPPAPEGRANACDGDGVTCSAGRARKLPSRRAANEAAIIAALPIGRTFAPASASPAAPPGLADAANTNVTTPVIADLTSPAAPAPKKVRKPPRRNVRHALLRDRRWRDQWTARAYAFPDSPYLRPPYQRSWGWSR